MADLLIKLRKHCVATTRSGLFMLVHSMAAPLAIPEDMPLPLIGPVLVDTICDAMPLSAAASPFHYEGASSALPSGGSGRGVVAPSSDSDEADDDDADNIMPRVVFAERAAMSFEDEKRRQDRRAIVECDAPAVPCRRFQG